MDSDLEGLRPWPEGLDGHAALPRGPLALGVRGPSASPCRPWPRMLGACTDLGLWPGAAGRTGLRCVGLSRTRPASDSSDVRQRVVPPPTDSQGLLEAELGLVEKLGLEEF